LDALRPRRRRPLPRPAQRADYRDQLRSYLAHGKPVAITEFGCCTYRGAADRGGLGFAILDSSGAEPRLDCVYERSEDEQVSYFDDLFGIFTEEKIEAAFWFTFAGYELPHRAEPRDDLDLASYGAVKVVDLTTIGADSAPAGSPKRCSTPSPTPIAGRTPSLPVMASRWWQARDLQSAQGDGTSPLAALFSGALLHARGRSLSSARLGPVEPESVQT